MKDKNFKIFDTQQEVEEFIRNADEPLSWFWDRWGNKYITCEPSKYSYEESVENMATLSFDYGRARCSLISRSMDSKY